MRPMLCAALLVLLAGEVPARAADELMVLETEQGAIAIRLLPNKAPQTVEAVKRLVQSGFYDGTTFHRVIPGYIIQGGSPTSKDADPKNDNFGGPGFTLKPEFNDVPHERGVVSLARNPDNPDSGGSQFFIVLAPREPYLDQVKFTVFGRVTTGMEVADRIAAAPRDEENYDRPLQPVAVKKARLVSSEGAPSAALNGAGTAPPGAAGRVRATQDTVNLREGPGTDRAVVQKVKKGTVLNVRSRQGEWVAVELAGGKLAYVRQDMVEPAP
jgi:peptidyl-prolyl cis-trans isomerase B (cyclophilin B)